MRVIFQTETEDEFELITSFLDYLKESECETRIEPVIAPDRVNGKGIIPDYWDKRFHGDYDTGL